jgi:hypothetical protein
VDSLKVSYSSGNTANRNDKRFTEISSVINQEFGAIVTKQGRIIEVYGIAPIVNNALKSLPDSLRGPQEKTLLSRQIESILGRYIAPLAIQLPDKVIAKDSSWGESTETVMPTTNLQLPIKRDTKETVKGFEERSGMVVVVLESTSKDTPQKTNFEEGTAKASVTNFGSDALWITRIEDKTGLLVHRSTKENSKYTITFESKQQPGRKKISSMNASAHTTIELLK